MRIRDGDFAYDVEPAYDLRTGVPAGWKYRVYALWPERQLFQGSAKTRQEAEREGQEYVDKLKADEGLPRAA